MDVKRPTPFLALCVVKSKNMNRQKKIIIAIIVIAAALLGYFLLQSTQEKKALENLTAIVNIGGGEVKITGRFACLPNRANATSTPVTGCILGFKGNNELYYALDTSSVNAVSQSLGEEDILTISGVLVPTKDVLGPEWQQFDLSGVIKVGEIVKASIPTDEPSEQ